MITSEGWPTLQEPGISRTVVQIALPTSFVRTQCAINFSSSVIESGHYCG